MKYSAGSAKRDALKGLICMAQKMMAEGHGDDEEIGEQMVEGVSEMGEPESGLAKLVKEAETEENEALDPEYQREYMKGSRKSPLTDRKSLMITALKATPVKAKKG